MKFNYQARTIEGAIQAGVVEASSKEAAISLLQKNKLFVTKLEEAEIIPLYAKKISFFDRPSNKDVVMLTRQLSIMFRSKITLVESLRVLLTQTQKPSLRENVLKISELVEGGSAFSEALSHFPKVFSPFYVSMVRSGETSGTLSESLEYLADHLEKEYHFNAQMKGAMIYPALVLVVSVVIIVMITTFVIPQVTVVLEESGQELPFITKLFIKFSNLLKDFGWLAALGLGAAWVFSFRYSKTGEGKKITDKLILRLPLIGSFLRQVYISRFAENLATLVKGGLPIARAIEITGDIVGNDVYKAIILEARDRVRRGDTINSVLSRFPEEFPPIFTQMVMVGEKSGTLDTTLMNIVDFYQKEVERSVENLLNLLEPLLILILGGMVGGLVAAVLIPFYQITISTL